MQKKWRAFGWRVESVDGHDCPALREFFRSCGDAGEERPTVLLANTIKGKGVPYMENDPKWHYGSLNPVQLAEALSALEDSIDTSD
jgi:transketolase